MSLENIEFVLSKIPFPPSVNEINAPVGFGNRFVKSHSYKVWLTHMQSWKIKNFKRIDEIQEFIKFYSFDNVRCLRVDCTFVLHKKRFITLDNVIKKQKNDTNNFLKPTLDALSKIIGIDDSFFNSSFIKREFTQNAKDEQVIIKIKPDIVEEFKP